MRFVTLVALCFLFSLVSLPVNAEPESIQNISSADYNEIIPLLEENFRRFESDVAICEVKETKHHLILDTRDGELHVFGKTFYICEICEGQERKIEADICVMLKVNGKWIAEYCDH